MVLPAMWSLVDGRQGEVAAVAYGAAKALLVVGLMLLFGSIATAQNDDKLYRRDSGTGHHDAWLGIAPAVHQVLNPSSRVLLHPERSHVDHATARTEISTFHNHRCERHLNARLSGERYPSFYR